MKKKMVIIALTLICMIIISVIRQGILIDRYEARDCMVGMDETLKYQGYDIKINSAEIWDFNAFFNSLDNPTDDLINEVKSHVVKGRDAVILACHMNFIRTDETKSKEGFDISNFKVIQNAYYMFPDVFTMQYLNQASCIIDLDYGESVDYTVLFCMYDDMVDGDKWENRGTLDYSIELEAYPSKSGFYLDNLVDKTTTEKEELCFNVTTEDVREEDTDESTEDEPKDDVNVEYTYEDIKIEDIPPYDYYDYYDNAVGGVYSIDDMPENMYGLRFTDLEVEKTEDIKRILETDYTTERWYDSTIVDFDTGEFIETVEEESYYYLSYTVENVSNEPILYCSGGTGIVFRPPGHWEFLGMTLYYLGHNCRDIDGMGNSDILLLPGEKTEVLQLGSFTFYEYLQEAYKDNQHIDEAYICFNPVGHEITLDHDIIVMVIIEGGIDR
ncbi:MAG: hypothetical protein J6J16_00855 [Lachnospiraceae bacterium]|nr:hypothetical protein [Lachnospiraceae bacterium]